MILKKLILVSFVLLMVGCSSHERAIENSLVGSWQMLKDTTSYMKCTHDGNMLCYYIDKVDTNIVMDWFFRVGMKSDTAWVYYYDKHGFRSFEKSPCIDSEMVKVWGDTLIRVNFKQIKGITQHIDECLGMVRVGCSGQSGNTNSPTTIHYLIPEGFTGEIAVLFRRKGGHAPECDTAGNPTLHIPADGYLETQLPENAFEVGHERYLFFYENPATGVKTSIPAITKFDKYKPERFAPQTIVALMEGFNTRSRDLINASFGKKLVGNVQLIYILPYIEAKKYMYGNYN